MTKSLFLVPLFNMQKERIRFEMWYVVLLILNTK